MGEATELIRRGDADVMLSGGAHSMIHPFGVTGFNLLTALSLNLELRARYPIALSLSQRIALIARFVTTTNHVRTYHTQAEMLAVADRILRLAGRPGLT